MIKELTFLAFLTMAFLTGCSENPSGTELDLSEDSNIAETVCFDETGGKGADALEDIAKESYISRDSIDELYVFVCGAVASPGVYRFAEGSRIYEAINAAGGFDDGADQSFLNLAETVRDGQQIYVPTVEEAEKEGRGNFSTPGIPQGSEGSGLININTASAAELTSINGIGDARAGDIISYRESSGGFSSIEDIKKVPGIKDGLFNKIKDKITV